MHRSGQLDDEQIRCFAEDGLAEQVTLSLSLVSQLPAEFIQQALVQESGEMLLVLARANGLSWSTVKNMLALPGNKRPRTQSEIPAMPGALREAQPGNRRRNHAVLQSAWRRLRRRFPGAASSLFGRQPSPVAGGMKEIVSEHAADCGQDLATAAMPGKHHAAWRATLRSASTSGVCLPEARRSVGGTPPLVKAIRRSDFRRSRRA